MFEENKIKDFFDDIKFRNVIPPISEYMSFLEIQDKVLIRYNVNTKVFSYKVDKSFIRSELRRIKLDNLLN